MGLLVIIGIAVGLAMDAFAVAVATSVSLGRVTGRQVFRFAFHFGVFQAGMPLVGWLAGHGLGRYIEGWDHWVAFALLAFIGGKAIITALRSGDASARIREERSDEADAKAPSGAPNDPTRGWTLLALSVATSIDALAVGLTFGVLEVSIWYPVLIIGLVTAALTVVGMDLGSRIGARFGRWTELAGGLVLIAIGIKILVEHLT